MATPHIDSPWPITALRFVAFIDIMGFKDMVAKLSHDDVYQMMQSVINAKNLNENFTSQSEILVKSTTYSDSIMLYSRDESEKSFSALISSVSGLTNDLFIEGIPHKGAIAYGTMTLDTTKSIFFGQPLIDSYLLQEELHFYGVIIHGSVEEKVLEKISNHQFIRKFDCPLKNGKSSHFTVYPMHVDSESAEKYTEYNLQIRNSLNKMRYKTSGHLRRYIDNTESYFDHIAKD